MNQIEGKPYVTGQELRYANVSTPAVPGLFWYSGWGYGNYYSSDGMQYWCVRSEAYELARRDGLKMQTIDPLEGYKGVYLGD